uniref:histidine kinase dimerization/phospho-acceptor domain-containing protein n=2 Tax=Streptococcus TaxID=1301 RepID=UPI0037042110
RISRGNYQEPIDYQGDREFEALTKGFNNMQESLAIAEQQTTLYEKNRTQMVADISHDLRTPLTSIKGYAKGVLDGVANTDEMRERYLQTIYQKSLAMEQLLEKLLLFSNLDTDQMPFDFQIVDLQEILTTYLTEKQVEFTDGQVQF